MCWLCFTIQQNGTLQVNSFLAVSFEAIEKMFATTTIAKYAYVYMVKPLGTYDVPAFCLSCFGTDNKFTAEQVVLRWKYILGECQKRGITVLTISSDGDTRLLTGMRVCTGLNDTSLNGLSDLVPKSTLSKVPPNWHSWFNLQRPTSVAFVQDTVHIAVKLKCRLLKPSIVLPMGSYVAGAHHLHMLQATIGKDCHGLRERDVDHKDKQNFDAVMHIIRAAPLLQSIPDAVATKVYIELVECVVCSFISKPVSPTERIEKIWFVTFFLRYWRQWIVVHPVYNLTDNYITSNAYMCIELNAHSLIMIIRTIRDILKLSKYFLPCSFSSQSCEGIFRSARSMSSVFSTFINFGMLGLLRHIHRLQFQSILQAESSSNDIVFPQLKKHKNKEGNSSMNCPTPSQSVCELSDSDIADAVQRAKVKARERIEELGMVLKDHEKWDDQADVRDDIDIIFGDSEDSSDDETFGEESSKPESSLVQEMCLDTDPSHVKEDLQHLSEGHLITSDLKEKLEVLQISLSKVSTSNSISKYEPIETPEYPTPENTTLCSKPQIKKPALLSQKPACELTCGSSSLNVLVSEPSTKKAKFSPKPFVQVSCGDSGVPVFIR